MELPKRGPAVPMERVLDQSELNEAVQMLKVGAEKFLGAKAYLRAGSLQGPILKTMGIKGMAANGPNVARILEAVKALAEAFGGEVIEIDPENN